MCKNFLAPFETNEILQSIEEIAWVLTSPLNDKRQSVSVLMLHDLFARNNKKKKMNSLKRDNWLTGGRMIRSAFSYSRQATEKYKFVSDTSKMLEIHPKASFTKYYCLEVEGQGRNLSILFLNVFLILICLFHLCPLQQLDAKILNIFQIT